ncbi:hypothetical protein CEXT_406531 [Caerostris extrusa]|uniref:Uncharacterized protein n=1 Tax=Caerostris extrusa TaxID=172846 RepID=A0AAV4V1B4_CAEEX|nr:hypothetical protein CEXT_406531 [Caerostris extrusa]
MQMCKRLMEASGLSDQKFHSFGKLFNNPQDRREPKTFWNFHNFIFSFFVRISSDKDAKHFYLSSSKVIVATDRRVSSAFLFIREDQRSSSYRIPHAWLLLGTPGPSLGSLVTGGVLTIPLKSPFHKARHGSSMAASAI